jgi:hypothetical protein
VAAAARLTVWLNASQIYTYHEKRPCNLTYLPDLLRNCGQAAPWLADMVAMRFICRLPLAVFSPRICPKQILATS